MTSNLSVLMLQNLRTLLSTLLFVYFLGLGTPHLKAEEIFQQYAAIPLPPYIDRDTDDSDKSRYQTVYANNNKQFSVAAPTAGLHFDNLLLTRLRNAGIKTATLNLHVGSGTFTPVKEENIKDHKIHFEKIEVSEDIVSKIKQTKEQNGRIIAVGTTSVRAL